MISHGIQKSHIKYHSIQKKFFLNLQSNAGWETSTYKMRKHEQMLLVNLFAWLDNSFSETSFH